MAVEQREQQLTEVHQEVVQLAQREAQEQLRLLQEGHADEIQALRTSHAAAAAESAEQHEAERRTARARHAKMLTSSTLSNARHVHATVQDLHSTAVLVGPHWSVSCAHAHTLPATVMGSAWKASNEISSHIEKQ